MFLPGKNVLCIGYQIIHYITPLSLAGRDDCPESFGQMFSPIRAIALSNMSVNDNRSNQVFRIIVRWGDLLIFQKLKIAVPIFKEPFTHISALLVLGYFGRCQCFYFLDYRIQHLLCLFPFGGIGRMKYFKHLFRLIQKSCSVIVCMFAGKFTDCDQFPNEMGPAKLQCYLLIFTELLVSRPEIAPQNTSKIFSQHVLKNLTSP